MIRVHNRLCLRALSGTAYGLECTHTRTPPSPPPHPLLPCFQSYADHTVICLTQCAGQVIHIAAHDESDGPPKTWRPANVP